MKGVREFYDATAQEWADQWYEDESMLPCLAEFVGRLPVRPRILDLGCGAGYESMRLKRLGAEVVGLDFSGASIAIARERNPEIGFHERDMLEDYSDLGPFDGIAALASLVHIPDGLLKAAFDRMAEALKPDGLALIAVRDGEGRQERQSLVSVGGEEYDRDFHAHSLKRLMERAAGRFVFVEELLPDEGEIWKQYLFRRL